MIRILQQELAGNRLIDSNVISSWRFDDNVLDSIGTNDGTYVGVNNYSTGLIGKSLNFAHNTSYITIPNNQNLSFTDGVNDVEGTITHVLKWTDFSGLQFFACKRNSDGLDPSLYREWQTYSDGTVVGFVIFDHVNGGRITVTHPFTPVLNQFYHIGYTYDGSGLASGIKMYINGINVGTSSTTGTYVKTSNFNNPLVFGRASWDLSTIYKQKGDSDEFRKLSIALTPDEMFYLATQELAGNRIIG